MKWLIVCGDHVICNVRRTGFTIAAPMDSHNPYRSPATSEAPTAFHSIFRIPWPATPARCFVISVILWPVVAIVTDLIGIYPERWFAIDDFGLAVSPFTWPACWLIAITLWFRAFMLSSTRTRSESAILALFALPLWFFPTAIMTLLMFPLGRISDTF